MLKTDTSFIYDGWNLIKETTTTDLGNSTEYYVWGLDLSGTFQGAGGIGGLLSRTDSLTGSTLLYTFDLNGNIGQLIDSETGFLAAHYEYDPFGNTLVINGPEAEKNPYRFSTKHNMPEFGWYDYGRRYYAPTLGRWPTRDPIGEDGGRHLYLYCVNAPLQNHDPYGLSPATWTEIAVTILGGILFGQYSDEIMIAMLGGEEELIRNTR